MALPGHGTFEPVSRTAPSSTKALRVAAVIAFACGLVALASLARLGEAGKSDELGEARVQRIARMEKLDRPEIRKWRQQQTEAWESEKAALEESSKGQGLQQAAHTVMSVMSLAQCALI